MKIAQQVKIALSKQNDKKSLKSKKKSLEIRKKEILEEKKTQPPEMFNISNRRELYGVERKLGNIKNQLNDKVVFNFPNKTLNISKDYLNSLKNPENYVLGLYARELRREQRKALKTQNFAGVGGLSKLLEGLNQKQGVSKKDLTTAKTKELKPFKKMVENGLMSQKEYDELVRDFLSKEKEKSYDPVVSVDGSGIVDILII